MTISNELGWFWKKPLVSTRHFDQYVLIIFWRKKRKRKKNVWVETNGFFQNHPNLLEIVITWCYRKPVKYWAQLVKETNTLVASCIQMHKTEVCFIIGVRNYLFVKNYVTSEGAVSHNVLYLQQLSIDHSQRRFYANNYFESIPIVSSAFKAIVHFR